MSEAAQMIQMKATPSQKLKTGTVPAHAPFQLTEGKEFGYYSRDGKPKSAKTIRMDDFGNLNRVQQVDPDLVSEKLDEDTERMGIKVEDVNEKTGIWRPSIKEETARPEDPPLYQPFRKAFHHAHNVLLSLKESSNIEKNILNMSSNRLLEIAGEVKKISLDYKGNYRSFISISSVNRLKNVYFKKLDEQIVQCNYLVEYMIAAYRTAAPPEFNGFEGFSDNQLAAEKNNDGKGIWQRKWWAMVQEVNQLLRQRWALGKQGIKNWVYQQQVEQGLGYMDPNMIGDLDYIGSLAKGYKSAPKQYIRFLPENFDVDARLDAPPLAVYAIRHGASVDRGSVKPQEGVIPKLDAFRKTVQLYLEKIPGVDKNDEFEVFIRADNVTDLVAEKHVDIAKAHKEEAIARRLQIIQDRIWWLRSKGWKYLGAVRNRLNNYIGPDGRLKTRITSGAVDEKTKNYNEFDLTFMEMNLSVVEQTPPENI